MLDSDAVAAARRMQPAHFLPPPSSALPVVQAKLVVGPVDDVYEQEADAVAAQVMRMAEPAASCARRTLQRQEDEGDDDEDEETLRAKPLADTELRRWCSGQPAPTHCRARWPSFSATPAMAVCWPAPRIICSSRRKKTKKRFPAGQVYPSAPGWGSFDTDAGFEQSVHAARGSGSPMPPSLRKGFEAKFGADFGGVRIHTGGESADLNRHVQAGPLR